MAENESKPSANNGKTYEKGAWNYIMRGMWRSPLGLMGVLLTTASATLMLIGIVADFLGFFESPYAGVVIFMLLPVGMAAGLILLPIAALVRRRQWHQRKKIRDYLQINLSNHRHRLFVIGFIILTSINFVIFSVIGFEGYHYTESNQFCGTVCHQVMAPEFSAYQHSPHARVDCVSCHIGSGVDWFVRAKVSGLRQVAGVMLGNYDRPIQTPVHNLRSSKDICESCHWADKYAGKKLKTFTHFSNEDQSEPEKTNLTLYVGGLNPLNNKYDGIHWHAGKDIQVSYLATDEKRNSIARVRVKREDGSTDEFVREDIEVPAEMADKWRTMDCTDCHNRTGHTYQSAESVIDFGLLSKKINREIAGIREDGLKALTKTYKTREDAQNELIPYFIKLQSDRDTEQAKTFEKDLKLAGDFLLEKYLANVWPEMNINWNTYRAHDSHENDSEEYGCFRCHDDEHVTKDDDAIVQDCDFCHNDPP